MITDARGWRWFRGAFHASLLVAILVACTFAQTTQWRGDTSSSWRNVHNWSGGIPTATSKTSVSEGAPTKHDVLIPAPAGGDTARTGDLTISYEGRVTFDPAPNPGLLIVHGSTMSLNGGELILGDGRIMFLSDVVLNNGGTFNGGTGTMEFFGDVSASTGSSFDPASGTVVLSGSGPQTISGNLQFNNLVVQTEGTVTISGTVAVTGSVTISAGSTLTVESGTSFSYDGEIAGDGTFVDENVLPVQMTHFDALVSAMTIELRWSTSTETSNHGFRIERRAIADVRGGPTLYAPLAYVPGGGTQTSPRDYFYRDGPLPAGRYAYRITSIDLDGTARQTREVEAVIATPTMAELLPNFPNPFNPATTIRFAIPRDGRVSLMVVDMLGRSVATLFDGTRNAGTYATTWDASSIPSGTYFCRLAFEGAIHIRTMQLIR